MAIPWSYFRKIIFFAVLTVKLNPVFAVRNFYNDSLAPSLNIEIFAALSESDPSTFIVPFSRAGNLIVLQGKADTIEGNFILDTGCPHLVLNLTYFRNYKNTEESTEGTGITESQFPVIQSQVDSFSFGGARYFHTPADLTNLGNIENAKGIKILGLIGIELLKQFEMIVDYDKSLIFLHRFNRKETPPYRNELLNDTSSYVSVPFAITDNRIIVQSNLAGKKINLVIDSGAESNLLDSRLPDRVFENVTITGRTLLSGAGNAKIEVLKGDLKTLKIGAQSIENLPVLITNLERTCFSYGGCIDGILSFDALSLKKLGFNFVTNKMYIWK